MITEHGNDTYRWCSLFRTFKKASISHPETVVWPPKRGMQSPQKHAPLCLWWAAELGRAWTSQPPSWWSFPHEDAWKTAVSRGHRRRRAAKGSSRWQPCSLALRFVFSSLCWPAVRGTWRWGCPTNIWAPSREFLRRGAAGWGPAGRSAVHLGPRSRAFPSTTTPEEL